MSSGPCCFGAHPKHLKLGGPFCPRIYVVYWAHLIRGDIIVGSCSVAHHVQCHGPLLEHFVWQFCIIMSKIVLCCTPRLGYAAAGLVSAGVTGYLPWTLPSKVCGNVITHVKYVNSAVIQYL